MPGSCANAFSRKFGTNSTDVLTGGTGGTVFPFTKAKALEGAIMKLGDELHSQYVVSFAPDPADEGYHVLEFRVTRKGNFQVRARAGYRLWPFLPGVKTPIEN